MRKRTLLLLAGLSVSSCMEPAPVGICSRATEMLVKSPSTYRLAKYDINENEYGASVLIHFDAQNGFGATVRGRASCWFQKDKRDQPGKYILTEYSIENDKATAAEVTRIRSLLGAP